MAPFTQNPSELSLPSMTSEVTALETDEAQEHEGTPFVSQSLLEEDGTTPAVERSRRGGRLECPFGFLRCYDNFAMQDIDC